MRAATARLLWLRAGLLGGLFCAQPVFAESRPLPLDASVVVDTQTKTTINGALKYLASQQHLDGSWSLREGMSGHPVAMTGYVLLAFMSAGNLPQQGEYKKNVAAGMQYLLDCVQPDGLFRGVSSGQYMYNHGIAAVALGELYGESRSPALRPKLERVINVILKSQNTAGGWRYAPRPSQADISVTVLQIVALRAAQEAGLAIPQDSVSKAIGYIHSCYNAEKGAFSYQPGQSPGFARTAAAVYSLQVLGQYDDPMVKAGSAYLFQEHRGGYWSYGNYYAAPAQYMMGGDTWKKWYDQVKATLLQSVRHNGGMAYWEPDLDGHKYLGPVFNTAVYVHILAMPYHFMPLYQR